MQWVPKFQYASRTDVGMRRQNNEDCSCIALCPEDELWLNRGHLFVVADGMGGHEVGELASKTAVDTLRHLYYKTTHASSSQALKHALEQANAAIHNIGTKNRDFHRMGTTCSTLVLSEEGFVVGHVGDSRVYRIREDRVDQLSFDHTVAWEQKLRKKRDASLETLDPEKYGHVLTRCLGPDENVKVDIEGPFEYLPNDVYVLCSDGLTKYLSDLEIGIYAKYLGPSEAARLLVNLANLRGGGDNCTVIVVRVRKQGGSVAPPPTAEYETTIEAPRWFQPVLFLLTVACGIGAGFLSWQQMAIPALGLGLLGGVFLLTAFIIDRNQRARIRREEMQGQDDEGASTVFFRPYRTAALRLSDATLEKLKTADEHLQHTARDNQWTTNWAAHTEQVRNAEEATQANKTRAAMSAWAKAIDIMFEGMPR